MKYKSKKYKNLMDRILSIYNVGEGDEQMASKLSRISGQKGAEKKSKDKVGKSMNKGDPSEVLRKMMQRIDKRMEGRYDS